MASAILRDELLCSICLSLYTDPVTLRCGHNFCRDCIDQVLDTQDGSGVHSCPDCREEFQERPALQRNITLHNVVERFRSTHPQETTGICCTYCVDSPVPAVKSCLLCEASLCEKHLRFHSKEAEHVLTDPHFSLKNRKCSIHKKVLEYYCTEDNACICVSCCLIGEHNGHKIESLDEASEKKKEKMKNVLRKLIKKKESVGRDQSLVERKRKAQEKVAEEAERVTALFIDIRRRLDDLETKVLSEISRQGEKLSLSLSDVIQKLELKKVELSRKMRNIEELCNMTDPLTVLQGPDTGDSDPEEGGEDEDTGGHDVDEDEVTRMLHAGFYDIITSLRSIAPKKTENKRKRQHRDNSPPSHTQASAGSGTNLEGLVRSDGRKRKLYGQGPADVLLDVNTANSNILISNSTKTATWTGITQNRPGKVERFQDFPQVMSSRTFTSGQHYWDVEVRGSWSWRVGMCYPSIDRRGDQSLIGRNNKSWCLWGGQVYNNEVSVIHNSEEIGIPHQICSDRVRICLNYEAGKLDFYELRDTIIHIYTFAATFTEPLHAVLYVYDGSTKISGGGAAVGNSH